MFVWFCLLIDIKYVLNFIDNNDLHFISNSNTLQYMTFLSSARQSANDASLLSTSASLLTIL